MTDLRDRSGTTGQFINLYVASCNPACQCLPAKTAAGFASASPYVRLVLVSGPILHAISDTASDS